MESSYPGILAMFFSAVLLAGCADEEARRQAIIDRGVEIQIEEFIAQREQKCKRDAIARAVELADSILLEEGRRVRIEPIDKPPIAIKPVKPPVKTLPDSISHRKLREFDG